MTRNILEALPLVVDPRVVQVGNSNPKGFGANHNAAFSHCKTDYFCVLNPDIEIPQNPFSILVGAMESLASDLAAPLVISPSGEIEDSARRFPTLGSLFLKALGGADGRYAIAPGQSPFSPDWVAGMFVLFRTDAYRRLGGFDEKYFLYYEDVDICRRAHQLGLRIVYCPQASAVHDARRASRRSISHMRWHMKSMLRYLWRSRSNA